MFVLNKQGYFVSKFECPTANILQVIGAETKKCYNHPRSHLLEIVALHAATRVVRHYVVAYNQIKKINHKASGSSFICPPWCGYRVKSFTVWPFNLVVFFEVLPHQGSFFFFFFSHFCDGLNPVQLLDFCFCFTAGQRSTSIHFTHWNPEIFSPHPFIFKLYCFRVFFWTNSERNPPTNTTPCSLSASVFLLIVYLTVDGL